MTTKQPIQFHSEDKVGFVYNNKLCSGTFYAYEMDNSEAIVLYNGKKLRFTDCSIYRLNENDTRNKRRNYPTA